MKLPITTTTLFLTICLSVDAFTPISFDKARSVRPARPSSQLWAGGFASGKKATSNNNNNNSKQIKLKPKQQWDRFSDLKQETKVSVGIRIQEDDDTKEWLEVGSVRSREGAYTAVSVALQRALIAEHAKRLYPLKVSPKKTLEWGFLDETNNEWKVVDKAILDEQVPPEGIEKMIGFEGKPDPATGYYCIYDGGKLKLGEESSFN